LRQGRSFPALPFTETPHNKRHGNLTLQAFLKEQGSLCILFKSFEETELSPPAWDFCMTFLWQRRKTCIMSFPSSQPFPWSVSPSDTSKLFPNLNLRILSWEMNGSPHYPDTATTAIAKATQDVGLASN